MGRPRDNSPASAVLTNLSMQAAGWPTKLSAHNSATARSRQREGQERETNTQERNQAKCKGKDQTKMIIRRAGQERGTNTQERNQGRRGAKVKIRH